MKCGTKAVEGAKFCMKCGAKLAVPAAPSQVQQAPAAASPVSASPAPAAQPTPAVSAPVPQPAVEAAAKIKPQGTNKDFSGVTVRYRCSNGHVFDGTESQTACSECGAPLPSGGFIQIYRMGNYMGCAVGMGVYIDDVPCGHIANTQSIRVSVPFGAHKVHITHTSTRKCNDPVFTVTPQAPYVWCKAHFTKAGFAIQVDQADPESMPEK